MLVRRSLPAVLLLTLVGCNSDSDDVVTAGLPAEFASSVLSGEISDIAESRGAFLWGDGLNALCQQWSAARTDRSGFVYGTGVPWSSADVYVLPATSDPLEVVAAENFPYTSGSLEFFEGETVFFRGSNGFFGAWTIDSVDDRILSGRWYFKAGGGGDFTGTVADEGSATYDLGNADCRGR